MRQFFQLDSIGRCYFFVNLSYFFDRSYFVLYNRLRKDGIPLNKRSAILFDLDGTLLPMDLEVYTKTYLHLLGQQLPQFPAQAWWAASGTASWP